MLRAQHRGQYAAVDGVLPRPEAFRRRQAVGPKICIDVHQFPPWSTRTVQNRARAHPLARIVKSRAPNVKTCALPTANNRDSRINEEKGEKTL